MISKKARWEQDKKNSDIKDTSADIITNCLKTSNETLSLWYVDKEEEIYKAIIALSANKDFLSRLDYIVIPDECITKHKLKLEKTIGESPYIDFNNNHFDIVEVKYGVLGEICNMIFELIKDKGEIKRVPLSDVKNMLINAINENLLNKDAMKESLLKDIV